MWSISSAWNVQPGRPSWHMPPSRSWTRSRVSRYAASATPRWHQLRAANGLTGRGNSCALPSSSTQLCMGPRVLLLPLRCCPLPIPRGRSSHGVQAQRHVEQWVLAGLRARPTERGAVGFEVAVGAPDRRVFQPVVVAIGELGDEREVADARAELPCDERLSCSVRPDVRAIVASTPPASASRWPKCVRRCSHC